MTPSGTPDPDYIELPRNLYFGVQDHKLAGLNEKYLPTERLRRIQTKDQAIIKGQHLISALKTVSSFDNTGNVLDALPHLADSLEDVIKAVRKYESEIEAAAHRYEQTYLKTHEEPFDMVPDVAPAAVEPAPQVSTAAGPKPGPSPIAVVNVHNADDVAQVKANLQRALARATANQ